MINETFREEAKIQLRYGPLGNCLIEAIALVLKVKSQRGPFYFDRAVLLLPTHGLSVSKSIIDAWELGARGLLPIDYYGDLHLDPNIWGSRSLIAPVHVLNKFEFVCHDSPDLDQPLREGFLLVNQLTQRRMHPSYYN